MAAANRPRWYRLQMLVETKANVLCEGLVLEIKRPVCGPAIKLICRVAPRVVSSDAFVSLGKRISLDDSRVWNVGCTHRFGT